MPLPPDTDPGRFWRRLARWGALLCVVGCTISFNTYRYECIWTVVPEILRDAASVTVRPGRELPLTFFVCLILPAVCSGPVVLLTGGKRLNNPSWLRLVPVTLLWASAVLPPFYFGLIQVNAYAQSDTGLQAGAAAFMAFLFVCGMTALMAWSARGKPSCFFWLGVVPLSETVLAWLALVALLVIQRPGSSEKVLYLIISACAAGSLMMLVGWLKWWAAVRKAGTHTPRDAEPASQEKATD